MCVDCGRRASRRVLGHPRAASRSLQPSALVSPVFHVSAAYDNAINSINNLFVAAGVIHLINAFMYAWSWLPLGYTWCSIVMIPEYLNMIGAGG